MERQYRLRGGTGPEVSAVQDAAAFQSAVKAGTELQSIQTVDAADVR
jgi:hypothetical protein